MKCKGLFLTLALVLSTAVFGQRYGVVDTDYILKSLPEYAQAKSQIDKLSEQWAAARGGLALLGLGLGLGLGSVLGLRVGLGARL